MALFPENEPDRYDLRALLREHALPQARRPLSPPDPPPPGGWCPHCARAYESGWQKGLEEVLEANAAAGYDDGRAQGEHDGFGVGLERGRQTGWSEGYQDGRREGEWTGYHVGLSQGRTRARWLVASCGVTLAALVALIALWGWR